MVATLKRLAIRVFAASAFLAATVPFRAEAGYPDRPIRLIVPYTPGGQFDFHARLLADRLLGLLKQPVVIENKPGAGTIIGAEYVKNSTPDGYTLLYSGANMLSILPLLSSKLPYKVSDFQTITVVSDLPRALTIDSKQMPGVNTVDQFVEFVRARPGKVDFAAIGRGGGQHLMGELVNLRLGLQMTPVIYRGTPEVLTALLSGQVSLTFDGVLGYLQNVQPGQQLKMLAVNSAKRLEIVPDVPSFAEIGYSNLVTPSTFGGIVVRAGTPREIVSVLHDAFVKANTDPKVADAVVKSGGFPITSTPEEFDQMVKNSARVWGEVIRASNIKLN